MGEFDLAAQRDHIALVVNDQHADKYDSDDDSDADEFDLTAQRDHISLVINVISMLIKMIQMMTVMLIIITLC